MLLLALYLLKIRQKNKMIAQTSSQAYEEYQKLRDMEDRLKKNNRGLNLCNSEELLKPKKYFIEVKKISSINLVKTSSKVIVNSDFPFCDYGYYGREINLTDFLKQLEKWVLIPRYELFIQHNRKMENKASDWDLPKFRNSDIKFEDVNFDIGKEAQHEINLLGFNFIGTIKKLLLLQREATDEEARDFERHKLLVEEVDNLKRQVKTSNGYYSYNREEDNTFKIILDDETYNSKLKKVEEELISLNKKYSFLKIPSIHYKEEDDEEEDYEDEDEEEDCDE